MRHVLGTIGLVLLLFVPAAAQQTALTEGQIKAAELEMPELAKLFELKPGMTVADVGAGFGAWTVRFSRVVGPTGRVYATDIGAAQLAQLRDSAAREGLTNVTVLEGAVESTNLPAQCCDAILIRDAYHHLTQPGAIVKSLAAALKPGGRLAVIDFPPRPKTDVPSGVPADRLGHGVPPEVVQRGCSAHTRAHHCELGSGQRTRIAVPGAVPQALAESRIWNLEPEILNLECLPRQHLRC
jgi:precorrin-6B methylase 2